MRTSVVLPAPIGPSKPNTIPPGTSSPAPSSATVAPKRLTTPSTRTAGTEEPRPFTPVTGPVPDRADEGGPAFAEETGSEDRMTCSLSAVISISSTGPCGSSRQTQVCHQAGDWSSPDRGDPPERARCYALRRSLAWSPRGPGSPRIWLGATAALKERDAGERGQAVHQLVLESRVTGLRG